MMTADGVLALEGCAAEVALLMSRLDERQRRWVGGLLVLMLPHGGLGKVAAIAGLDEKTVARGRTELEAGLAEIPDDGRVRKPGGGRPRVEKNSPNSSRRSRTSSNRKSAAIRKDASDTFAAA